MNPDVDRENIGQQLGTEGVGSIVSKAEAYCACEERRIALTNEPRILALQAEGKSLMQEEEGIAERLKHEPPPGDVRSRRRRAVYYWAVTILLATAGFVFSVYALEPFRLGLKAYLYSLGVAMVLPFLADSTIVRLKSEALIKWLAAGAFGAALLSLVLLAAIRAELMVESLKDSEPVITFDDAPAQTPPSQNTFYDRTIPLLQLTMILLAISMELAAGLAIYEAWRLSSDVKEDWSKLRKRMKEIHERKGALVFEIVALENAPKVFHAMFWKEFYRAMFTHTVRSMIAKGLIFVSAMILVGHGAAMAQSHTTIVIALDLSRSVDVRGPDGKTEFQKDVDAVTKQLAQVPADSRLTIIAITDHSFTQPYILVSATIPADPGYFSERLKTARVALVQAWKLRAAKLEPRYGRTDIFGALALASQLFAQEVQAEHKTLVIYSDMRNSTSDLNLEVGSALRFPTVNIARKDLMADLRNVRIDIVGVDGAGESMEYWQTLHEFWAEYFHATGAELRIYSALRQQASLH